METQHLINYGLMTVMAVIGWFAREMWSAVKELRSDLAVLRSELLRDYVCKNDYREDVRELKEIMNKVFDKLDGKADR